MSVETEVIAELGRLPTPAPGARPNLTGRGLVLREHPVARCRDAEAATVLLQAPAGFGKTTVLAQWESADPRPFRWVSADWRHNDPALLLTALAAALNDIETLSADVLAPLSAPPPNLDLVTTRLCEALAMPRPPMVIVLDDLHLITDPESLDCLTAFIEAIPPGTTIAAAARDEPALPLGRLRGRRMLNELHMAELTMNDREATDLLAGMNLTLSRAQVERLVEHTEGWAAGLYLAALLLLEAPDVEDGLRRFYGDERLVADYLRDEFLSGLSSPDLDFLTRTSVLDRLNGSLCDAVLERSGSARDLGRLARSNLLLIPLDGRDREYRYHALLREMLEAELRRLGESVERDLHARASRWYASADDHDHAVRHAVAAGDVERAGELIWDLAPIYESSGRGATLRAWLSEIDDGALRSSAPLCLTVAAGWATLGDGALVEEWTSAALAALEADDSAAAAEMRAIAALIRAAIAERHGVVRMAADMAAARESLPMDSIWLSMCAYLEGLARHLAGETEAARALLEEGARRGSVGAPNIECLCRAQLGLLELDEGDPMAADESALRAIEMIARFGLEKDPTQAISFAVAALVHARGERTESAAREVTIATALLEACNELSPWYEAEARIVLARALLLLDDVPGARAKLGEAGRHLRRIPDAEVLRGRLQHAWEDADAARAVTGRWPLTPAELRLLHHLPSHHSFREIAEELFVSTNTVKTQARSIYRKLGVSSRAEAVECAQSAGLLEAPERPREAER